jgi:hypothetical protein
MFQNWDFWFEKKPCGNPATYYPHTSVPSTLVGKYIQQIRPKLASSELLSLHNKDFEKGKKKLQKHFAK